MSQLTLIRHGQAAAFTDDSDRLTELGKRQARAFGDYLVARSARFDQAITGGLKRQLQTAALVADAYREAGQPWPEATGDEGWNEYDAGAITGLLMPALSERDPAFAKLVDDTRSHAGTPEQNRYFQRMFERLMACWVAGEHTADGVETFAAFHARICDARARVLDGPGSRKVAVFTSGGPIGACVQLALDAPVGQTMRVNWRVMNGSLTEFTFSRDRLSLDSFNRLPHLDDPALQSYR